MKTRSFLARSALLLAFVFPAASQVSGFVAGSDSFAGATEFTDASATSAITDLTTFTKEGVTEPWHGNAGAVSGGKSAWWLWRAPDSGFCTISSVRSAGEVNGMSDTVLAVYTGGSLGSLSLVAANDDYSESEFTTNNFLSQATFYAVKGTAYRIAVDGWSSSSVSATRFQVVLEVRLLALKKTMRMGLFNEGNDPAKMGNVVINTTPAGSLTGKLNLGGTLFPFAGVFSVDGTFTASFARKVPAGTLPKPPVTLLIDGTGSGRFLITLGNQDIDDGILPEVAVFTTVAPALTAGYYTAYVTGGAGGYGTLTATVKPTGAVTAAFFLLDGTVVTAAGPLLNGAGPTVFRLPVYKPLAAGKGAFLIDLGFFENGALDDLGSSAGYYVRPAPVSPAVLFYPSGISSSLSAFGGTYVKPAAGQRALAFLDATAGVGKLRVTAAGGEIAANFDEALTLSPANKVAFGSALRKPALALNPATGLVTGSITEPYAGTPLVPLKRTLKGVLSRNGGSTVRLYGSVGGKTRSQLFQVLP